MPTPTSTRWVDTLVQRVDRIRRAHNLCELQRTTYVLVAAALAGATVLLVTALFGSTRLFAVLAWSTLVAFVVTATLLVHETIRRWLRREDAVAWIESRTALGGRLRSLVELHARGEHLGTRFFLPLLWAENERALPSWEPRRLVPRRVPRAALAVALVTTFALLAALTLTPVLYPRVPALADTNVATMSAHGHAGAGRDNGSDPDDGRSPLASIPANLQERIRQAVWGRAWDRVREAMAEAARDRHRTARNGPAGRPGSEEETEGPWQLAERARPNEQPSNRDRRGQGGADDDAAPTAPTAAPRGALVHTNSQTAREGRSGAGAGAGTSTSPNLYGAAAPPDLASHARFELGLVTRMRLQHRRGRPRHTGPPRAPDQRPLLTISDRREEFAHEMAVPRAYEPIVRQVFAHRAAEGIE